MQICTFSINVWDYLDLMVTIHFEIERSMY